MASDGSLAVPDLTRFYQQVADLLAPDGWVANLDTMSNPGPWRDRLRSVRTKYRKAAATPDVPTHPQINLPGATGDHVAALRASGFAEIDVVWKLFVTELVMARKLDPAAFKRA